MQKDLVTTRTFAFSSLSDFAQLDLTIWGVELYEQYACKSILDAYSTTTSALPAQAASFLETEATTNTQTGTKFYAALAAPFFVGGDSGTYLTVYHSYKLYAQYVAAAAGKQSTAFSNAALKNGASTKKGKMYKQAARSAWMQFSAFTTQAAHIDYITSLWTLYNLFILPNTGFQQPAPTAYSFPTAGAPAATL